MFSKNNKICLNFSLIINLISSSAVINLFYFLIFINFYFCTIIYTFSFQKELMKQETPITTFTNKILAKLPFIGSFFKVF